MRFSEAIQLGTLRNNIYNLLEYCSNWQEFDPYCPQENYEKAKELVEQINTLLERVEEKMEQLGRINVDSYEY